jgi:hypothetical protein
VTGTHTITGTLAGDPAYADSTAQFDVGVTAPTRTLTVSKTGSGTGRVTSDVGGIDCGSTCSATVPAGTVVTLTATPGVRSSFGGWSGAGCSGTGTCAVTMTAAKTVTATFALQSRVGSRATADSKGDVGVDVTNPNSDDAKGSVTLDTTGKGKKLVVLAKAATHLGRSKFRVPGHSTVRVKVHLSKAGRALLKRQKKLKVKATVVLTIHGKSTTSSSTLTIRPK